MLHLHYQMLTNWLHQYPAWGVALAFIVAFAESVAVIGTIVPGTVTMTAVGILIGSGIIPTLTTLSLTVAGAVCGDALSYHLGSIFKYKIPQIWPFRSHPHWLNNAKQFFYKHGGKSIIIGRFVGPIRAFIPVIAGILNLQAWRFYPVDIIAATCWAIVYLFPGYVIGVAASELPTLVAAKLIAIFLGILIGFWLIVLGLKLGSQILGQQIDRLSQYCWRQWVIKGRRMAWLYHLLRDARKPRDHGQLTLIVLMSVSLLAFVVILALVISNSWWIVHLDWGVHHLLRGLRTPHGDIIMAAINSGTNLLALSAIMTVAVFVMAYEQHYRAIAYWLITLVCIIVISLGIKVLHPFTSPPDIAQPYTHQAFPSLNFALACSIYGFIAWLICFKRPAWKTYTYPSLACILGLLALARIYLSLNWLSSMIAGFLLATTLTVLAIVLYQRHRRCHPRNYFLAITLLPGCLIIWLITAWVSSYALLQTSQRVWHQHTIHSNQWWQHPTPYIPTYRYNRLGYPAETFNIQWAGSITQIESILKRQGWQIWHIGLSDDTITQLAHHHDLSNIDWLAQLYNYQKPQLRMIKQHAHTTWILRLWSSHIRLTSPTMPLWIGTLNHHTSDQSHVSRPSLKQFSNTTKPRFQDQFVDIDNKQVPASLKQPYSKTMLLLRPSS